MVSVSSRSMYLRRLLAGLHHCLETAQTVEVCYHRSSPAAKHAETVKQEDKADPANSVQSRVPSFLALGLGCGSPDSTSARSSRRLPSHPRQATRVPVMPMGLFSRETGQAFLQAGRRKQRSLRVRKLDMQCKGTCKNPQLECLPNLYKDLQKVFKFPKVEKVPQRVLRGAKEQEKTSDEADSSGSDSDGDIQSDKVQKQPRANRKHIDSITLVEIAQYFHLPIREASKTLKIGVSILKRKCRKYGIPRWPHRKIKSLDSLIQDLEYVLEDDPEEEGRQELLQMEEENQAAAIKALTKRKKMLESEKEILQQKPASDLMTETKLFREDVFKRRYRAKSAAIDMEMEMETE